MPGLYTNNGSIATDVRLPYPSTDDRTSAMLEPPMTKIRVRLKQILLVAGDYAVFHLALLLMLLLRYGGFDRMTWISHALPFSILGILWVLAFYVVGLYDLTLTRDSFKFFRSYLEGMMVNLAIAFGFFYLIPGFGIAPRTNLLLYFACALLLGYAWRLLYNRIISPALFRNRVLFVGPAADAERLHELLQQSGAGFELAAVTETAEGNRFDEGSIAWNSNVDGLHQTIKERNIQTLVLGHRPNEIANLRDALYRTLFTSVNLVDRASLEEAITGRVPLELVSQTWFLEHLREHDKAWYEIAKRIGDVIMAVPIGLFALFTFPFIALLVKLSSPGQIFIRQQRVGKHGRIFTLLKYRSMVSDDESSGHKQFTAENDPRITPIGKFLRTTRLDELPQVWNVIRGDMSFVGPRPERPVFVDELMRQMPFYTLRHLTRPGLTGWAQVRYKYAASLEDNLKKLQYDLYYIKNRSLFLDGAILLKTIGIVLKRQGT